MSFPNFDDKKVILPGLSKESEDLLNLNLINHLTNIVLRYSDVYFDLELVNTILISISYMAPVSRSPSIKPTDKNLFQREVSLRQLYTTIVNDDPELLGLILNRYTGDFDYLDVSSDKSGSKISYETQVESLGGELEGEKRLFEITNELIYNFPIVSDQVKRLTLYLTQFVDSKNDNDNDDTSVINSYVTFETVIVISEKSDGSNATGSITTGSITGSHNHNKRFTTIDILKGVRTIFNLYDKIDNLDIDEVVGFQIRELTYNPATSEVSIKLEVNRSG